MLQKYAVHTATIFEGNLAKRKMPPAFAFFLTGILYRLTGLLLMTRQPETKLFI